MKIIFPETKLVNVPNALVDEEDYSHLCRFRWNVTKKKNGYDFYYHTRIDGKWVRMTHLILPYATQVDHINHDTCDNRRQNLRVCNTKLNSANRIKRKGTSQFKGVHWSKKDNIWRTCIKVDGKTINLGMFRDQKKAAIAYNKAALMHFGNFANLNDI